MVCCSRAVDLDENAIRRVADCRIYGESKEGVLIRRPAFCIMRSLLKDVLRLARFPVEKGPRRRSVRNARES